MALKVSANAVRKSRIISQREGMAARSATPGYHEAQKAKGLYGRAQVSISRPSGDTPKSSSSQTSSPGGAPRIKYDAAGQPNGVYFSADKDFSNLTYQQVNQLMTEYKNRKLTPDEQKEADRIEINKKLDYAALTEEEKNKRLEAKVTPEQLAQVGESVPEILNAPNEISAAIEEKQAQKEAQERLGMFLPMTRIDLAASQAGKLPIVGEFAGGVLENLKRDEKIRDRLESYRMDDEYALVSDEIDFAKGSATQAKRDASRAVTDEEEDSAIANFNAAWARIEVADGQLKKIAMSGDQREWVDEVKKKQAETKYLLEVVRPEKEYQLRLALQGKIRTEDIPEDDFAQEGDVNYG
jgi:hypothetical protein